MRVSLTGALYHLKGYPEGVPNVTMRIDTRRHWDVLEPSLPTEQWKNANGKW